MSFRKRKFQFEHLENRELMAGDVTAFVSSGNLYIVEQSGQFGQANAVTVDQLSNGQIRVSGRQNADGGFSYINGATSAVFNVAGAINVQFAGGSDYLNILNTTVNELQINLAGGGADHDSLYMTNVRTYSLANISTGNGNDSISVHNSTIGDNYGIDNLNIRAGAGADTIQVGNPYSGFVTVRGHLNIYASEYSSEVDADIVKMTNVTAYANVQVITGGGSDLLEMKEITAGNDVFLSLEGGADTARLDSVQAIDDFWTYMGEGDDYLETKYLRADQMTLDGGAGIDRLAESIYGYWNAKFVTGFEPFRSSSFSTSSSMTTAAS